MKLPLTIPEKKSCKCCGAPHPVVPANARANVEEMYFWECSCKSTMCYVPDPARTKAIIKANYDKDYRRE